MFADILRAIASGHNWAQQALEVSFAALRAEQAKTALLRGQANRADEIAKEAVGGGDDAGLVLDDR